MDEWAARALARLEAEGLFRDPGDSVTRATSSTSRRPWIDACSNDYLGLGRSGVSRETLETCIGIPLGAGASRLVQGTTPEHERLESELADWLRLPAALVTSSAFAANQGLVPALALEPDSLIVSDASNHASIIDGCRLARGRTVVVPHLDLEAIERALSNRRAIQPAWVVTEGLFSMDGDSPDLKVLRELCDRFEAGLILDEAHSIGVSGPEGAGLAGATGVRPDLIVAGLGKAVAGQGGVIASSRIMRTLLWNRSRSFVFSTAPSPVLCRLLLEAVRTTRRAEAQRARLAELARALRTSITARGLPVGGDPTSPIVPVILGSNERALRAMNSLRARGVLTQAIRPPTVPPGAARLRLTVHADWPEDAIPLIVEGLEEACAS